MKAVKGYKWGRKNLIKLAKTARTKAGAHAYRDRRNKKRDFRSLWIQRINAAAREHGLTYARFMNGVHLAGIAVDRKVLAEIAVKDAAAFKSVFDQAKSALDAAQKAA